MSLRKPVAVRTRPVRTVTVCLEADGYEETTLEMRVNAPLQVLDQLDNVHDVAAVRRAAAALIVHHNLVDEVGAPIEIDQDAAQLTADELWLIVGGYYKALRERSDLPKDDAAS